ncbi:hypothetical protein HOLleu_42503 [Holothuria leucospilota]|uniref:Reverse transcriptase domain-containing protein n=1 Tax=Holothuria leucospilota TaxID=206669 RepID=A0A9Q0YAU0_HOLLE|nr:hypothetical protein HOLleu_42503 [Holothuria leucospilota]
MCGTMENKKIKRRTSRARFTRQKRTVESLIDQEEPLKEILESFQKLELAYAELQDKHDEYCETIEDTDQYNKEEEYLEGCQDEFLAIRAKVKAVTRKNEDSRSPKQDQAPKQPVQSPQQQTDGDSSESSSIIQSNRQLTEDQSTHESTPSKPGKTRLKPRIEKPKLPIFTGDVREYRTFKDDFRHMIDQLYEPRDAVSILRTSLTGRPLEMLRGIGTDYNACWEYLDMTYGNPRVISDAVTQDITKFRPLKEGEDARFSELAHLMTPGDRKVWTRHLQQSEEASLKDVLNFVTDEMKGRMRATASVRSTADRHGKVNLSQQRKSNQNNRERDNQWKKCWGCGSKDHWPDQCERIQELTVADRLKQAKDCHVSFSCLKIAGKGHSMKTCRKRKECTIEGFKTFHHPLLHQPSFPSPDPSSAIDTSAGRNFSGVVSENEEDGVAVLFLTANMGNQDTETKGFIMLDSGATVSLIRESVAEQLNLKSKPISVDIGVLGGATQIYQTKMYKMCCQSSTTFIRKMESVVGRPLNRGDGAVDVLIGVNYSQMHVGETREVDGYVIRRWPLGWVMFGVSDGRGPHTVMNINVIQNADMAKFWSTEEMGVKLQSCDCRPTDKLKLTLAEREDYKEMWRSCEKVGNRWMVPYPWKRDPTELTNNKGQCMAKLQSIERRLMKDESHAVLCDEQMREMVKERPEKKSTPVRVVFNSSAIFKGQCLKDFLSKGPDLLNNLFDVLLRFRQSPVAVSGDISKMFHKVLVPERDKHVHRFLWRSYDTKREPDVYVKEVVTFGDKPAPAMALTALKRTAEEGAKEYPEAARVLHENTYMDDICTSVRSREEAKKLINDVDKVLEKGSFKVKEWVSNLNLRDGDTRPQQDNLPVFKDGSEQKVLSKTLMQKLWQLGCEWDDDLPEERKEEWKRFYKELKDLDGLSFERCLMPERTSKLADLIIFCDASEEAFGAVVFIRWELDDQTIIVRFIAARSRVAPLKMLSIPRLELQAAVIASRLYSTIEDEMSVQFGRAIFLTDSIIALSWIRGQSRQYKSFVANRVSEIQSRTDPSDWRHVPGK